SSRGRWLTFHSSFLCFFRGVLGLWGGIRFFVQGIWEHRSEGTVISQRAFYLQKNVGRVVGVRWGCLTLIAQIKRATMSALVAHAKDYIGAVIAHGRDMGNYICWHIKRSVIGILPYHYRMRILKETITGQQKKKKNQPRNPVDPQPTRYFMASIS